MKGLFNKTFLKFTFGFLSLILIAVIGVFLLGNIEATGTAVPVHPSSIIPAFEKLAP